MTTRRKRDKVRSNSGAAPPHARGRTPAEQGAGSREGSREQGRDLTHQPSTVEYQHAQPALEVDGSLTDRHLAGFATYDGDCRHMIGEVKGPTTYGSALVAIAAVYDHRADRTRVQFAHCRPEDARPDRA